MTDSYVQVPPDSTGKKVETHTVNDGTQDVERQVIAVADATQAERFLTINSDGSINTALAIADNGSALPGQNSDYIPVRSARQKSWRCGFDRVYAANAVDTAVLTLLQTGSGMAVSQSAGNLVVTTGTTANSESVIRSIETFTGDFVLRASVTLSQRITNNNFYVELVDVIGDGLALTVNSAVSITVTIPNNPFTAANVGQSMYVGVISGVAGVPGRYAIASVSGNNVTFTVAGWPGSGSGTVSLFGWNYHQLLYTSTSATSASYDCQRNGWNSGVTTAAVSTTASGHIPTMVSLDSKAAFFDQVGTSVATPSAADVTQRATRIRQVPDSDAMLYLQIRAANGTTNPASTTTFTVGFVDINQIISDPVTLSSINPFSANAVMPVAIFGTSSVSVTNAPTVIGSQAHDSAGTASPVRVAARAHTTAQAAVTDGDVCNIVSTTVGAVTNKPFSIPELDWTYPAATGGISNTTTAVTIKAAAAANIRNYITGIQISSDPLGAATELAVRDGAGGAVLWRMKIGTAGVVNGISIEFPTPLRGTAATLLEIVTLSASITGGVFVNAQGYTAP